MVGEFMKDNEKKIDTMLKFLTEIKNGKYVEINTHLVEIPRNSSVRDDYVFDDEMPLLYSMSNSI